VGKKKDFTTEGTENAEEDVSVSWVVSLCFSAVLLLIRSDTSLGAKKSRSLATLGMTVILSGAQRSEESAFGSGQPAALCLGVSVASLD